METKIISCVVCVCPFKKVVAYKQHLNSAAHQEKMGEIFQKDALNGRGGFPFIMVMKQQVLYDTNKPIIGLSLLTACVSPGSPLMFYLCHVCEEMVSQSLILTHLFSANHYVNYYNCTDPNRLSFAWIPSMDMRITLRPEAMKEVRDRGPGQLQMLDLPGKLFLALVHRTYSEVMHTLCENGKLLELLQGVTKNRMNIQTYQRDCKRKHPLLGMQHLVECICVEQTERRHYLCTLCCQTVAPHGIIKHVISLDHIHSYFTTWHPGTLMSKKCYKIYPFFGSKILEVAKQTEEIHQTADTDMKVIESKMSQMHLLKRVCVEPALFTSVSHSCYAEGMKKLESIRREKNESSLMTNVTLGPRLECHTSKSSCRLRCQDCSLVFETVSQYVTHVQKREHQQMLKKIFGPEILGDDYSWKALVPMLSLYKYIIQNSEPIIGVPLIVVCISSRAPVAPIYICFACEDNFPDASIKQHLTSRKHLIHTLLYQNPWQLPFAWEKQLDMQVLRSLALEEQRNKGPNEMMVKVFDIPYLLYPSNLQYQNVLETLEQYQHHLKREVPSSETLGNSKQKQEFPLLGQEFIVQHNVFEEQFSSRHWAFLCLLCERRLPEDDHFAHVFSREHVAKFLERIHPGSLDSCTDSTETLLDLARQAALIHPVSSIQKIILPKPIWEPCSYHSAKVCLSAVKKNKGKGHLVPPIIPQMKLVPTETVKEVDKDSVTDDGQKKTVMTEGTGKENSRESTDSSETALRNVSMGAEMDSDKRSLNKRSGGVCDSSTGNTVSETEMDKRRECAEITTGHRVESGENVEKEADKETLAQNEKESQRRKEVISDTIPERIKPPGGEKDQAMKDEKTITDNLAVSRQSFEASERFQHTDADDGAEAGKEGNKSSSCLLTQKDFAWEEYDAKQPSCSTSENSHNCRPSEGVSREMDNERQRVINEGPKAATATTKGLNTIFKCTCDQHEPIYLCERHLLKIPEQSIISHVAGFHHQMVSLVVIVLDQDMYKYISEENFNSAMEMVKELHARRDSVCGPSPISFHSERTSRPPHAQHEFDLKMQDLQVVDMDIDPPEPSSEAAAASVMTSDDSICKYTVPTCNYPGAMSRPTTLNKTTAVPKLIEVTSDSSICWLHFTVATAKVQATPSKSAATSTMWTATPSNTAATGIKSTATPSNTSATGIKSTATPSNTAATSTKSIATPSNTAATSIKSTATPSNTAATGTKSIATPSNTAATSIKSTATPSNSAATGIKSTATPSNSVATGTKSIAYPSKTAATSTKSKATPSKTAATSIKSTATPSNTAATGIKSTATPSNTAATGIKSTATPSNTAATGSKSTATPSNTAANGIKSTATPSNTAANGIKSTATPSNTAATSIKSTATPSNTAATSIKSKATPSNTAANGIKSTATPSNTAATSIKSTATPSNTAATGIKSTAPPSNTAATGVKSTAAPSNTAATPSKSTVTTNSCTANTSTLASASSKPTPAASKPASLKVGINQLITLKCGGKQKVYCQLCSVRLTDSNHLIDFTHQYNCVKHKYPEWTPTEEALKSEVLKHVTHIAEVERKAGVCSQVVEVSWDEYKQINALPVEEAVCRIKSIMRHQGELQISSSTTAEPEPKRLRLRPSSASASIQKSAVAELSPSCKSERNRSELRKLSVQIPEMEPNSKADGPLAFGQAVGALRLSDRGTERDKLNPKPITSPSFQKSDITEKKRPECPRSVATGLESTDALASSPHGRPEMTKNPEQKERSAPESRKLLGRTRRTSLCLPASANTEEQSPKGPGQEEHALKASEHSQGRNLPKVPHNLQHVAVGLASVWECRGKSLPPFFLCESCGENCLLNGICHHVESAKHHLCYISKHYSKFLHFWREQGLPVKLKLNLLKETAWMLSNRERISGMDAQVVVLSLELYERVLNAPFDEAQKMVQNISREQTESILRQLLGSPQQEGATHEAQHHPREAAVPGDMEEVQREPPNVNDVPPNAYSAVSPYAAARTCLYHQQARTNPLIQPADTNLFSQAQNCSSEMQPSSPVKQPLECPTSSNFCPQPSQTASASSRDEPRPTRPTPAVAPVESLMGLCTRNPKPEDPLPAKCAHSSPQPMCGGSPKSAFLLSASTSVDPVLTPTPRSPEDEDRGQFSDKQIPSDVDKTLFEGLIALVRETKSKRNSTHCKSRPKHFGTSSSTVSERVQKRWDAKSVVAKSTIMKKQTKWNSKSVLIIPKRNSKTPPNNSSQRMIPHTDPTPGLSANSSAPESCSTTGNVPVGVSGDAAAGTMSRPAGTVDTIDLRPQESVAAQGVCGNVSQSNTSPFLRDATDQNPSRTQQWPGDNATGSHQLPIAPIITVRPDPTDQHLMVKYEEADHTGIAQDARSFPTAPTQNHIDPLSVSRGDGQFGHVPFTASCYYTEVLTGCTVTGNLPAYARHSKQHEEYTKGLYGNHFYPLQQEAVQAHELLCVGSSTTPLPPDRMRPPQYCSWPNALPPGGVQGTHDDARLHFAPCGTSANHNCPQGLMDDGSIQMQSSNAFFQTQNAPQGCAHAPQGCVNAPQGCVNAPQGCVNAPQGCVNAVLTWPPPSNNEITSYASANPFLPSGSSVFTPDAPASRDDNTPQHFF